MPAKRIVIVAIALVTAGGLLGCRESEGIRRYTVARAETPRQHLIVAMFERPERTWFFKLEGPEEEAKQHRDAFERFVQSVRFTGDEKNPVKWAAPEGWERVDEKKELRYATFRLPSKERPIELVVTPLGREASELLPNVNRWRGQLGLAPIAEHRLSEVTRKLMVNGVKMTVVEMTGTGRPGPRMPPMAAAEPPPVPDARPKIALPSFTAPETWQKLPGGQFRFAAFRAGEDPKAPEVTVIPLPGGQNVVDNVNRWREQVNLPKASTDEVNASLRELASAGGRAKYVDLIGPEGDGRRQRILAAIISREGVDWFVKMTGPPELVERQKQAFETFVRSVDFKERQAGE